MTSVGVRTLVIETATAFCSVALLKGSEVHDARHVEAGRGHAERLLPMIAELTDGGRADAVLVDCGPGSFTGIRVGIAAARALGFAWCVPVSAYHSLALLAAGDAARTSEVTVAIEGGHGQLFVARYAGSPLTERAAPRALAFDAAVSSAADARVIGNAAKRVVAARGWGDAIAVEADARLARFLPPALTALVPTPFYGRSADAVPLRAAVR